MTKEEEKAIERLKNYKEYILKCGNKKSKHFKAVVTVLNILKKMKIQEENYKNLIVDVEGIAKELEERGYTEDEIKEILAEGNEAKKQVQEQEDNNKRVGKIVAIIGIIIIMILIIAAIIINRR